MKNILVTTSFVLFSLLIFGQTNLNELERLGEKWTFIGESEPFNGDFIETNASGNKTGSGTMKDGLLEGERILYFDNGQKFTVRQYSKGFEDGLAQEFYENGKLKQEGHFKAGREIGKWTVYYETGEKHGVFTFENGVQNGEYLEYDKKGNLTLKLFYRNGMAGYSDEFMTPANDAMAKINQGKFEDAIKLLNKAVEVNPTVADAYFNRGYCKASLMKFKEAILDYDKTIELSPNKFQAYGNRGNAKINMLTANGNTKPTSEETQSACEDLNKAKQLGDTSISTNDLIFIYCNGKK